MSNFTGKVGLLDNNGFNFTTLIPTNSSTNPLPLAIKIGGYCFGTNLDITLYQVTGNISLVKSKVFTITGKNVTQNLTQSPTTNLVIIILYWLFSIKKTNTIYF